MFNRSLQIISFHLLRHLTVKIIIHTTSIRNQHYYQNWNQNLFTFQRSFIIQGCKICHNMNLMQYKKCKCENLVYVPMLPTMKSSNENGYWLARKLNFILPGQATTKGKSHFTSRLRSWKMSCKSNTKFPFITVLFLGVWGMTASSYIVYDYTNSGHPDLQSMYVPYKQ